MGLVNHLKTQDTQNMFLAVAYGKHLVTGHLAKSDVSGSSGSHTITAQQLLGRGPWDGCEGLWFKGLEIEPANYKFYPGIQSPGMGDSVQGQDSVFNTDTPHSGVAWLRAAFPTGVGDFDTETTPPVGLRGIFRTMKVQDYDENGLPVGAIAYSPSAALQTADLILRIGERPPSRIHWPSWCAWRDFMAGNITHDYRLLADQDGFGLTARYYNGSAFDTFVVERVDPVLDFVTSSGSPGIDIDVDNFSARFEGYIRFPYSETFTIYGTHTHGLKIWIDDMTTPLIDEAGTTGEHSDTFAATEGVFYPIKIEWTHTTGDAELRVEWQSTSEARDVVSHRALLPKTADRPRYETHPFFSSPTRLDDAVRTVLSLCNSTYQEVNGQLRFFCLEQVTESTFSFTPANTVDGSLKVTPRDPLNLRNSWKVRFRNVDSRYLEEDLDPVIIERDELIAAAGRKIDGDAIDIFNCNRHQAYRTLEYLLQQRVDPKWTAELTGNADSYAVLAGDQAELSAEFLNWEGKPCRVLESNDASSESTADERRFVLADMVPGPPPSPAPPTPEPEPPFVPELPNTIGGHALQLRAKAITGLSATDPVSTWSDTSLDGATNNRHFTQSGSNRPTYQLVSGDPVVRFDGSDDYMTAGDTMDLGTNSLSMFIVAKRTNAVGTFLSKPFLGGLSGRYALVYDAGNGLFGGLYDINGSATITNDNAASDDVDADFVLYEMHLDRVNGEMSLYREGSLEDVVSFTPESANQNHANALLLGHYTTGLPLALAGDIKQIDCYLNPGVVDGADLTALRAYYAAEFSL